MTTVTLNDYFPQEPAVPAAPATYIEALPEDLRWYLTTKMQNDLERLLLSLSLKPDNLRQVSEEELAKAAQEQEEQELEDEEWEAQDLFDDIDYRYGEEDFQPWEPDVDDYVDDLDW